MSQQILDFISVFSGLCSIAALLLYFVSVPKEFKTISLLVASLLIGLPSILFLIKGNVWIFSTIVSTYSMSIIVFSYLYGKAKAAQKFSLNDFVSITNKRPDVQNWIIENVSKAKNGKVHLDAFGVKLDALYKVMKGASYKSKLSHDVEIDIRALILEPFCAGVVSRAKIEKNDRVLKDVELMKTVWSNLVLEYENHINHDLKVKTYDFTPSFYIIRIDDSMLIGTYLAESGYENLTFHLQRNDGKTFYQFERYFECIWNDCSNIVVL